MHFLFGSIGIGRQSDCVVAVYCGWSGGAMALGNLPVPGRPTIWMIIGQGPTALAVGAGCLDFFYSHVSLLSCLPLFGRRPDID